MVMKIAWRLGATSTRSNALYCDNQSVIALANNPIFHARTKHIALQRHFIREQIEDKQVSLLYCKGEDQTIDIPTKPLCKEKFQIHCKNLGLQSIEGFDHDVNSPSKA